MPADPGSTKRLQQIIIKMKQAISLISSDTRASIGMIFKGATIKQIPIKKSRVPTKKLSLDYEETVKINEIKKMYVLTKDYPVPEIDTDIIIDSLEPENNNTYLTIGSLDTKETNARIQELKESIKEKEKRIFCFTDLDIPSSLFKITVKPIPEPKVHPKVVSFEAKLHSIEKLTTEEPNTRSLLADKFKKPAIKTEDTTLRTYSKKRSPSFPTNLPIEKKPTSLLLFTERDLSIFKRKLADKHKVNIQLIKITSVYNNLNVNNIQNLKYDPNSGNVYYTFKPKTTTDGIYAFMVFGIRRDNNTSISAMVNVNDLKQT